VSTHPTAVRDLDHVVMTDGRIYRVVGNLDHSAKFVGYNVYSPDPVGDRLLRSTPYRKNFTEDDELPNDALDTYRMLPKARICEHLDPHTAATTRASTYADSPWAGLHAELNTLFGANAVGIFGSAMLGMHLTPDGTVRKDVDFVIEGTGNIPVLREHLPAIRSKLRFTEVTSARQGRQYERYRRVFRNDNNSTDLVITRRWTALQAPNGVVTTIRFRDAANCRRRRRIPAIMSTRAFPGRGALTAGNSIPPTSRMTSAIIRGKARAEASKLSYVLK
jgi:hypothetical protein